MYKSAAVAASVGVMAIGFAGPASAEDLVPGMYNVVTSGPTAPGMAAGNAPTAWTVFSCGSGCAQIVGDNALRWDARLTDGQWVARVHRPDAVNCENGFAAPGWSEFTLDADTLHGNIVSTSDGPACGSPTPITTSPIFVVMDLA
jgi:hypothetical protein